MTGATGMIGSYTLHHYVKARLQHGTLIPVRPFSKLRIDKTCPYGSFANSWFFGSKSRSFLAFLPMNLVFRSGFEGFFTRYARSE
jgi:hypothetical protein